MGFVRAIPLLLGVLLGPLLGVLAWGFWRVRRRKTGNAQIGSQDSLFVALSALAAIALALFLLTYLLLGLAQ
jgi:cytosine/uracil/thiamine/allantoin permease